MVARDRVSGRYGAGSCVFRVVALLCLTVCLTGFAKAADSAWESLRAGLKNRPRPLILNSDGNEMVYYPTNAPVTAEGFFARRLDEYRGTKISTLAYCPWSSGFGLMTTTRAGEYFDAPIDLKKDCTNATPAFAAKGLDCLDMVTSFCRTNGMEIFVSIRVNDTHDRSYVRPGSNPPRSWLFPKWKDENPDCLCGEPRRQPPYASWTAVDFENPKVRDYMKKFVSEFANNYDVDGIEYDFMRHGPIFKSVAWGASATEAQLKLMTDFMRELRDITEAAGRKRGRPILVLVRTSDSLAYAKEFGIDVEDWLKSGVMDLWSVSDYFQLDYLKPNADLAHKHGVRFYSALAESRIPSFVKRNAKKGLRCLPGRNTVASFAAEYAAAMTAGCDGVESFNLSVIWNTVNGPKLLQVDPREASAADKAYFAFVRGSGGYRPEQWLKDGSRFYRRPRIDPGNPIVLPTDETFRFAMELGEGLAADETGVIKVLAVAETPVFGVIGVNGREVARTSFKDGIHAFRLSSKDLRPGLNEFALTPSGVRGGHVTLNDFAIFINNKNNKGMDERE